MSVLFDGQAILVAGECGAEEAETLLALLQTHPHAAVDITQAGSVHTALWQVMLALSPSVHGEPANPFIHKWIMPMLKRDNRRDSAT